MKLGKRFRKLRKPEQLHRHNHYTVERMNELNEYRGKCIRVNDGRVTKIFYEEVNNE